MTRKHKGIDCRLAIMNANATPARKLPKIYSYCVRFCLAKIGSSVKLNSRDEETESYDIAELKEFPSGGKLISLFSKRLLKTNRMKNHLS